MPVRSRHTTPVPTGDPVGTPRIGHGTVWLFAVATGVCVANLYYSQPLLDAIASGLGVSHSAAALTVTLTQLGYATGLITLLPLGDLLNRRRLVPVMAVGTACALAAMAAAPSAPLLLAAAVAVGLGATTAQVLVPYAADLATDAERGKVVGTVMSGLLLGILLARTVAGYLEQLGGWRTVYVVAAVAMVLLAGALWFRLPAAPARTGLRYPALLASTLRILREEPVLRLRAVLGALAFAVFSVLWTALTFLLSGAPYHYADGTIGLFGLLGAAGALAASAAGRIADRGHAAAATTVTSVLLALSWLPLWLGGHRLYGLLVGVVVLDLAVQGLHVTNQSQVYRLRPEARSRINSAYMTTYFIGGAIGSSLAPVAYDEGGWTAVSVLGAALGAASVVVWGAAGLTARRHRARAAGTGGE
ncbi:MFS transporter [Streptomyces sp. ICBB 8177]|uniref:MFS transporter n=1 Tax=Streptomyces sp. ICBB 8177 TaxID=563922 RepID=UPI000D680649|nr:MFS transporter [Streptomyces sp. ICBB 8177]PWI44102.1 MFS transporter [Streptomyces sp. ICBB 8177]